MVLSETGLREKMRALKIGLKEAAAVLGIRPTSLSNKLSGWSTLTVAERKLLAEYLESKQAAAEKVA